MNQSLNIQPTCHHNASGQLQVNTTMTDSTGYIYGSYFQLHISSYDVYLLKQNLTQNKIQ